MTNCLFFPYGAQDIAAKLRAEPQADGSDESDSIRARQEALATYQSYLHKDASGKPVLPEDNAAHAQYVDIPLSPQEARTLGLSGPAVSLHQLLQLTRTEVVSPHASVAQAQSMAAYLLSSGERDPTRYNAHVAEQHRAYEAAARAFALLSRPVADHERAAGVAKAGQELRISFDVYARTEGARSPILLARQEYESLTRRRFDEVSPDAFSGEEQRLRDRVNKAIAHSQATKKSDAPNFEPVFDPARLLRIETLMRHDATASWMLDAVKKNGLPVTLYRYLMSDADLHARDNVSLGNYMPNRSATEPDDYLQLFVNGAHEIDLAVYYTHESRHHWQDLVFPACVRQSTSPTDKSIFDVMREADAQAVHRKAAYRLQNQTGLIGKESGGIIMIFLGILKERPMEITVRQPG